MTVFSSLLSIRNVNNPDRIIAKVTPINLVNQSFNIK